MQIQFQCNLADYNEALAARRSLRGKTASAVIGCALVVVAEIVVVNLGVRQGMASLIIGGVFAALWFGILLGRPIWVARDFQNHPNFQREQVLTIDEEGLHRKSEVEMSTIRWAAYTGSAETRNLFLFYLGKRLVEVVPKRALSESQLVELREMLQRRLPPGKSASSQLKTTVPSNLA